jgi:hypothetical protein
MLTLRRELCLLGHETDFRQKNPLCKRVFKESSSSPVQKQGKCANDQMSNEENEQIHQFEQVMPERKIWFFFGANRFVMLFVLFGVEHVHGDDDVAI